MNDSPAPSTSLDAPGAPLGDSEADPLIGRLISERYRVLERIAQGGMGAVYLGEHVLLRKRVAIKILRPEAASEPQLVGRFEREAVAGAHVSHPHVAVATDFGREPDGCQFLVLEYVRGRTLAEEIQRGPLTARRAVAIARQLASALEAVHDKEIVHRDVKPRNVILSEADDGAAKLVDFGFAKVRVDRLSTVDADDPMVTSRRDLTVVGTVFGTVAYMPPEIGHGMDQLDARADLYALGVTLYEMLAGVPPFAAASNAELFAAIMGDPPPPIAERARGVTVPAPIEGVVLKLLEKDPAHRFQTATEVLAALDAAATTVWGSAPTHDVVPARSPAAPPLAPDTGSPVGDAVRDVARGLARQLVRLSETTFEALARNAERFQGLRPFVESLRASPPSRRSILLFGAPVLALLLLTGVWITLSGDDEGTPTSGLEPITVDAARPAEPAPVLTEIEGIDVEGWAQRLSEAAESKIYNRGAEAFLAVAKLDASYFERAPTRADAIAVAVGIAFEENAQADAVFSMLEDDLGQEGLEMLYEIVRSKRGTKAYERAVAILGKPAVAARATPALRLAYEMRRSTCAHKKELFARAPSEGDERVLTELKVLKYAPCRRRTDPCCFRDDAELTRTIDELAARLARDGVR